MKRTLIDHLNHEIRSPLTVIVGMTDLLLMSQLTAEQRQCLATVKQASDSLLKIMNDVVEFARLEEGRVSLAEEEFVLAEVLAESAISESAGVEVGVQRPAELPERLVGDAVRLKQVLTETARQAARVTRQGRLKMEVSCRPAAEAGAELSVRIAPMREPGKTEEDSGGHAGDEEDLIEPSDWSQWSAGGLGGQGFGMAAAAGLVSRMGGRLWASRDRRAGHFRLSVPMGLPGRPQRRLSMEQLLSAAGPGAQADEPRDLSILVAEDTPANLKLIERLLAGRGHRVTSAENGREAVEAFARDSFDVVLLDVEMPVIDGWQAAEAIRRLEADRGLRPAAIIALSGHGIEELRDAARAGGVDSVIEKPFDIGQFCKLVESLGRRSDETALHRGGGHGNSDAPGEKGVLDYRGALERLGGNARLFRDLVQFFHEDAPGLLREISAALESRDGAGLQRAAHSLKGLVSNFGAQRAVEAAQELERQGATGRLEEGGQIELAHSARRKLEGEVALLDAALDRIGSTQHEETESGSQRRESR